MDAREESCEPQERTHAVDFLRLKPGLKVKVTTCHHIYNFEITDKPRQPKLQGGKYFPEQDTVVFNGSTAGNSMILVGWIVIGLHLELIRSDGLVVITSPVKSIGIQGDNWYYEVD